MDAQEHKEVFNETQVTKEKQENLTKKKRNRSKKKMENPIEKKKIDKKLKQKSKIIEKIKSTETLFNETDKIYQRSKQLYEEKAEAFDLDKIHSSNKKVDRDQKWTADIIKSGTFQDKISALSLYIRKEPRFTMKYVDMLIKICKKKNRKQLEMTLNAVKSLFVECLLTNKKTLSFSQNIDLYAKTKKMTFNSILEDKNSQEILINFYIEDFIHKRYYEFVQTVNQLLLTEPLNNIKKKMMRLVLELIIAKPEREDVLLEMLVNKLGDPDVDISNFAIKLLKELQNAHHKMSLIIIKFVERFLSQKNLPDSAKFYAIVFLSQMELINNKDFIEAALKFFFDIFNTYSDQEDEKYVKYIALIIKSLNILCKFCKENNINLKSFFEEKLNLLFKLSHSKSLKLRYQVLKLIFYMSRYYDTKQLDRFYKSLYDLLLTRDIVYSKYIKEIFLLLQESFAYDTNIPRVSAFLKRLLQCAMNAEPSFTACALIVVSQILRNKNKIWKIIDKPELKESEYDPIKREPQFSQADTVPLYELSLLAEHYHPSIKCFAEYILKNYNTNVIDYNSDPIIDFSLINFLDKFMIKNPESKTKREKKKTKYKGEKEEEQGEGQEQEQGQEKENKNPEITNKNIEFIKIFQKKEEKVTDLKKKKKKKLKGDIDKIADEMVEKEYAKLEGFDEVDDLDGDEEIGLDDEDE